MKYTMLMLVLIGCVQVEVAPEVPEPPETSETCDTGTPVFMPDADVFEPDAGMVPVDASAADVFDDAPALSECEEICAYVADELDCALTTPDATEALPCAHACPDLLPEWRECLREAQYCFKAQDCINNSNIYSSD